MTATPKQHAPFCVLVPSGPGQLELDRLDDLMDACLAYADLPLAFVVINDGNDKAAIERIAAKHGAPTEIVRNARNGKGNSWTGGLTVGELDAFLWIARNREFSGILRMDSDALVINPFARQIADLFASDPSIGAVGSGDTPTGDPLGFGHHVSSLLYWGSKPVSYDRTGHRLILSLWGWRRKVRLLINRAVRNGYRLGDWCQGGAYAISPEFIRRLNADPSLQQPHDFLPMDYCEDVLMSVLVYALGLKIHFTTGPRRLFASKWRGLYGTPAELAERGQAVIHSLKDHQNFVEADTRAFYRERRRLAISSR